MTAASSVKMSCQILTYFSVFMLCLCTVFSTKLTDITEDIFTGSSSRRYIAAYGDYNADKLVDIFLIHEKGV